MLSLLHTADWHLGQTFHGFERDYEHSGFLSWLLETLVERNPDALLVAGDVFDSVNPSAAAQRLFYDFLAKAHAALPGLDIVIVAGNHDAAARLEAPAGIFASLNVTVVGTVARDLEGEIQIGKFLVPLRDKTGAVAAIAVAVPFLRPSDLPHVEAAKDAYLEGIRLLYSQATAAAVAMRDAQYPGATLVGLGHCHMLGGAESLDSERRLIVGGAEALGADTFPDSLAYVALGHLHQPQQIDHGRIRYCGSPIPLSFSEREYQHTVLEVTLEAGLAAATPVRVPKCAWLVRLPAKGAAPLQEVLGLIAASEFDDTLAPQQHPFLEIHVLDDGPDPTRRQRIHEALTGKPVRLASIKLVSAVVAALEDPGTPAPSLADLGTLDPELIMVSAYQERYHSHPEPAVLNALREILIAGAFDPAGSLS